MRIGKSLNKFKKNFRQIKRSPGLRVGLLVFSLLVMYVYIMGISNNAKNYDYSALLDTIAKGESAGNYNAYYGNARNKDIDFTSMTVEEVLNWQEEFVNSGSPSSAVGKYQFIRPTLKGLIDELKINSKTKFDKALQDKLAVAILERRGVKEYLNGKLSRDQFAHNLSKEWAALPRVIGDNPKLSYYDGDGLNKVGISIEEINFGIESIKAE